jgi:hypothetical protein
MQSPDVLAQKFREANSKGEKTVAKAHAELFLLKFKDDPKAKEMESFLKGIQDSIDSFNAAEEKAAKEAMKNIRENHDEFKGVTWLHHKLNSKYNAANEIALYFGEMDGKPLSLLGRIKYTADDWLFVEKVVILADGAKLEIVGDFERDNGSGSIWEWYDWQLTSNEITFFKKIANSKVVKIRYNGRQYYNDRVMTSNEKKAIKEMIKAFEGRGGVMPTY